jgi:minor extracellular serine protease Vpr
VTRWRYGLLLALTTMFLPAVAETIPDRFIIRLSGQPAARFSAQIANLKRQHAAMRATLEARGARVTGETTVVSNLIFVQIAADRAASLSSIPGVLRVYPVRLFDRTLDHALPLQKVPDAWNQIGGAANAGVGIKLGIIDTGVDPQHPAFIDPALVMPDGFPKTSRGADVAFTSNKVIVARSYPFNSDGNPTPALDTDGHGTGNAMIVAGAMVTGPNGPISGIAPKAFIGNYKVFADDPNSRASDDMILQALDDAVSDGMDIINLSLGTVLAPRLADDVLAQAVEAAVQAGKIVTISAGNSGSDPNTIGSPGIAPGAITVGSTWNDRDFESALKIDGGATFAAYPGSGPNSAAPISGAIVDVAQIDPTGFACDPLPQASLTGAIALILRGVCLFQTKINNAQQAGAVAVLVYTDAARPDPVLMQVDSATLPAASLIYSDGVVLKQQLAAGPIQATIDFAIQAVPVRPNRLSSFSSRGPSSETGIKPDMAAVGQRIYKAGINSGFNVQDGTSFAAPMVAGAAALIEAARPGLTSAQYRSLLVNSGTPVIQDSGTALTIQQAGMGLLNVLNALNSNIAVAPVSVNFGSGSGTVDRTVQLNITNLGSAPDTFSIEAQPQGDGPAPQLPVNTVQLDPGQSQAISVQLTADSLGAGAYQGYLKIQGTQNAINALAPYWYGVPSGVPTHMTVLLAPTNGAPGSRPTIIVRPTDDQGLIAGGGPTVTSSVGSVTSVQSADSSYPGAYRIAVRLARGTNVFHVSSGGASADITIQSP